MDAFITTAILAGTAAAAAVNDAPTRIQARATSICGQWDTVETGIYTVYQDLWNEAEGTGSQCTTVDDLSDDDVLSWSTSWSWSDNASQVKSFANVVTNATITDLASISSIPTIWSWSYTGTDIVADVSYDLFTSSSADGSDEYEIMIWLDAIGGAGPISSTGNTVDTPTLAGTTWDLYSGPNGATTVFSFVAASAVEDFSGDLMDFLNYLIENQGLASSQYLLSIGAGSEPFTGTSAVFSVASYSCTVETGAAAATATTSAAIAASTTSSVEASATSSSVVAASSASSISSSSEVVVIATPSSTPSAVATPSKVSGPHGVSAAHDGKTTSAAVVTPAPVTSAVEASSTLATSTKKTCNKRRSE